MVTIFHGPNLGYVLELYERYLQDPHSVDAATRAFFEHWTPPALDGAIEARAAVAAPPGVDPARVAAAAALAQGIREYGHLAARVDPLGSAPPGAPELDPATHGITAEELAQLPASIVGGPAARTARNAREAIEALRRIYCGSIGYEYDHIQIAEERVWLRDAAETERFCTPLSRAARRALLERLTQVEVFERYLHRAYPGQKRFSLEGCDILVPLLDEVIRCQAQRGNRQVFLGMAHRGRLNVLAHILGKPYEAILSEFEYSVQRPQTAASESSDEGWTGDVKYHLGAYRADGEGAVLSVPITLAPNPSHLEFVNPVVEGMTRAAQDRLDRPGAPVLDLEAALAVLIHGDASFPGQGIVAETLNLSQLAGYQTGGTVHIIVNNQIGFTTEPSEGRSTLYASDLAKGFEIPIVHVNADDPEACLAAARLACAYRDRFHKDFLIDLVGYRRWGHNEQDEPAYTQPLLYERIRAHPTVRELWARRLIEEGIVTPEEVGEMERAAFARLDKARRAALAASNPAGSLVAAQPQARPALPPRIETGVPAERLRELNEALLRLPEGFALHPRLARPMERRRAALDEGAIDWAHAETLAFASLLAEGVPVRLTGQDTERGTFSQRHLVLHDVRTGQRYTPLAALPQARASFAVFNSPLSENAVLGFEYGYSVQAPRALVLWEAQFGDFANAAQVIIDQFIASGKAKWCQTPALVLLLPHGYEGQGPEHSSARPERFLQLAAEENLRIVNCTTAAQYFHVLRRQARLLDIDPRPLVLLTPKSLLRHPLAMARLDELATGRFLPVLDDPAVEDATGITRLLLCSGKIYVDLASSEQRAAATRTAIVRLEELYPFPDEELAQVLARYPSLKEAIWVQEEPRNMGAWSYVAPLVRRQLPPALELRYVGRPSRAAPAEGSAEAHAVEQARIVREALGGPGA
jgi:2-oxoglutarate dehydrogenase E1 component